MKGEIEPGAFIGSESGDDGYKVVIRCSSIEAMQKAHRAVLEQVYVVHGAMRVPEEWKVKAVNDHGVYGYQISSPRVSGVRANTSIWEDSEDPAEQMLYQMLADRKGVES